jgi:hypothetical protein
MLVSRTDILSMQQIYLRCGAGGSTVLALTGRRERHGSDSQIRAAGQYTREDRSLLSRMAINSAKNYFVYYLHICGIAELPYSKPGIQRIFDRAHINKGRLYHCLRYPSAFKSCVATHFLRFIPSTSTTLAITMPCTIITEYDDYVIERHNPGDTTPSLMTPLGYKVKATCTTAGCKHPDGTPEALVLDFDAHEMSWVDNGTVITIQPATEAFRYLGPLEKALIRKGELTIWSKGGWTAVDTAIEKTTGRSLGGKVMSGSFTDDPEETATTRY